MKTQKRTYSELIRLKTFEDRFEYLKVPGSIGEDTFGYDRYLNQRFYHSPEWRKIRLKVISRDFGCDLGVEGHDIPGRIYIHHMNPIAIDDIANRTDLLLNPEYLICCSSLTHDAIHFGDFSLLPKGEIERKPGDTVLWRTNDTDS